MNTDELRKKLEKLKQEISYNSFTTNLFKPVVKEINFESLPS